MTLTPMQMAIIYVIICSLLVLAWSIFITVKIMREDKQSIDENVEDNTQ